MLTDYRIISAQHSTAQMKEYGHSSRRRRRRCLRASLACLVLLIILGVVAVVLAFTVFRVRDPTTQLVSTRLTGVSPSITFPAIRIKLNITMDLDILVYNPNRAAFSHDLGETQLYYHGTQVGSADVEPGRIPSRGSEHVAVVMTVEADLFAAELGNLLSDVTAGEVGFDANTRMPGRVTFLGIFKLHAVALSECHVVVGFPDLKVRRQECTQETKL